MPLTMRVSETWPVLVFPSIICSAPRLSLHGVSSARQIDPKTFVMYSSILVESLGQILGHLRPAKAVKGPPGRSTSFSRSSSC